VVRPRHVLHLTDLSLVAGKLTIHTAALTTSLAGRIAGDSVYRKKVAATHTYPFNGPFAGTNWVSQYQRGKTNLDFTEARDSEWQWNQLGRMQVCTSLQTDNHASTSPLKFRQARCPSCRPTNSVKALKAHKH